MAISVLGKKWPTSPSYLGFNSFEVHAEIKLLIRIKSIDDFESFPSLKQKQKPHKVQRIIDAFWSGMGVWLLKVKFDGG